MPEKLKIAVIGCGQISDAHMSEIQLIPFAEVAGICDLQRLLAEDTADRFDVRNVYTDYRKMINELNPDVVHITTPPHTHRFIGVDVMKQGCHTYIEKPFGINYQEAKELIEVAEQNRVIVCAGFSQLFDSVSKRLNEYIYSERMGEVVHIETYYGNSLEGNFSRLFLQNKNHWLNSLPGKLFQNIISHALYHVVPLLPDEQGKVVCFAKDRSRNGAFQDELRVMMEYGDVTSYLTFTSAVRPVTQFLRIYGTNSIVEADLANHIFTYRDASELPGPFARTRNALVPAKQLIGEGIKNIRNMANGSDRFFAGMGNLFKNLYMNIIEENIVPPVPYGDVLKCSDIMDKIALQCQALENRENKGV